MNLIDQLKLERFLEKTDMEPMTGCWLWNSSDRFGGYGGFWRDGKVRAAHREAWILFKGEIPANLNVLHRCDVRCCVNPYHLFLGTSSDNMKDMVRKGRNALNGPGFRGEDHSMCRLTEEQVKEMRKLHIPRKKGQYEKLSKLFGVSKSMVAKITNRRNWKHI